MGLSWYYILRSWNTFPRLKCFNISWQATIYSLKRLKEIYRIWKSYLNIGITLEILRYWTSILLYSKIPKHSSQSYKPQYQSKSQNLVSKIGKLQKLRNVSFLLLYSKVLKSPVLSNTPQYQSNNSNLVSETGKNLKSL